MHGAAQAAVEAGLAGEDLGHGAVEQEVDGDVLYILVGLVLDDLIGLAVQEVLHDVQKLFVGQLFDGGKALGQDIGMGAVGAEDEVVHVQMERLAHGGRLLTHGQVRRAGMVVGHAVVFAGLFDEVDHRLELAQGQHVAIDVDKLLLGEVAQLVLDGLFVLVDRNVLKVNVARGAALIRVNEQLLGHRYQHSFF